MATDRREGTKTVMEAKVCKGLLPLITSGLEEKC